MGALSERIECYDQQQLVGGDIHDSFDEDREPTEKYNCDIELLEFLLDSFICLFPEQTSCMSCHDQQEDLWPPLEKFDHRRRDMRWYWR